MRPSLVLRATLAALVLLAFAGTSAASAARLVTSQPCYVGINTAKNRISVAGDGFTPSGQVRIAVNGKDIGNLTADAQGVIGGTFGPDTLKGSTIQRGYTLTATDLTNAAITATATYLESQLTANFQPSRVTGFHLEKIKGHFYVYGFGALLLFSGKQPTGSLYVHWLRPNGTAARTQKLGKLKGVCGSLTSKRIRIFPFANSYGHWKLAFDQKARYSKHTKLQLKIGINVRKL